MESLNRKKQKVNVHTHCLKSIYKNDQCSNKLHKKLKFQCSSYQDSKKCKINPFLMYEFQSERKEVEWI